VSSTVDQVNSINTVAKIVEILSPLSSEERTRIVRAAMALLGEAAEAPAAHMLIEAPADDIGNFSPRAQIWMKQNSITSEHLDQVFHVSDGVAEVIAPQLPGKNKKEQTYSAYMLAGLSQLLLTGNASFGDKEARALCERAGCYDSANHSVTLRNRGNEFTGSKEKGWTLTAPGLKRAAEIVKELGGT
jgi:hypothetical protein